VKTFHTDQEDNGEEQEDNDSGEKVKFYFRGPYVFMELYHFMLELSGIAMKTHLTSIS